MTGCSRAARLAWSAAALAAAAAACGDFAHTNPLDPGASVQVSIVGPDSLFSMGDTARFTISTDPAYTPAVVAWSYVGTDPFLVSELGPGRVRAEQFRRNPAAPAPSVTVTATVDGRQATKTLVIAQRPVSLELGDCGKPLRTIEFVSINDLKQVCAHLLDRRGNIVLLTTSPTITPRKAGVVTVFGPSFGGSQPDLFRLFSAGNGTTQVVVAYQGFTDSLEARVHQVIRAVDFAQKECKGFALPLPVGQSVQLVPTTTGYDAAGTLVADTSAVRAAIQGMQFIVDQFFEPVTLTPDGLVTGNTPGSAFVIGRVGAPGPTSVEAHCRINVQ